MGSSTPESAVRSTEEHTNVHPVVYHSGGDLAVKGPILWPLQKRPYGIGRKYTIKSKLSKWRSRN